jgi:predicted nucleic acid-binding protein|tara:strand:+ start:5924 stop:6544 length:621 start_codon:yes stop_codon:yes gene_type:complete
MTCLSSLSDTLTPLVPDTSVLINLHACTFGEQVLRAIPNDIVLPETVVAELNHETSHANGENGFIQRLISGNVVKVVQMDDAAARLFETMIRSPGSLDDGEAATIAVAVSQGFQPVVDERKGRARAQDLMNGQAPAWSLDLLVHPAVQSALVGDGYIEAVYLALREGRMRIDEERCDAVVQLIGIERAKDCTSLPGFKARRESWLR